MILLARIVSGGQSGADRAALDWAIDLHIPHGGWCPAGRWAEDGPLPARYALRSTESDNPAVRTEWNVRDSDATVIVSIDPVLSGGSRWTAEAARALGRPWWHVHAPDGGEGAERWSELRAALQAMGKPVVLNVAGPRASEAPEIYGVVYNGLDALFRRDSAGQRAVTLQPGAADQ